MVGGDCRYRLYTAGGGFPDLPGRSLPLGRAGWVDGLAGLGTRVASGIALEAQRLESLPMRPRMEFSFPCTGTAWVALASPRGDTLACEPEPRRL